MRVQLHCLNKHVPVTTAKKLVTDIAASAMQYRKIYQKAALKDKRMPREKKVTLQMCDLEKALEEHAVDVGRLFYNT